MGWLYKERLFECSVLENGALVIFLLVVSIQAYKPKPIVLEDMIRIY